MGFWQTVKDIATSIGTALKGVLEWAGSETTQASVIRIIEFAVQIATLVEKFRSTPLTGPEKQQFVRLMFKVVQQSDSEELYMLLCKMGELKNSGELEGMTSAEVDMIIGSAIGGYMAMQGQDGTSPEDDGFTEKF